MFSVKILLFFLPFFLMVVAEDQPIGEISVSNANFGNKLYQIISKDDENKIFSPISVHAALSLAYQGASGDTAEGFRKVLNIPVAKSAADGYKTVMNDLNNIQNVTLHVANKIYIQEDYKLKESFRTVATDYFYSDTETVNFVDNIVSANKINHWVQNKTNDKITNLISPDDLNSFTCLVLVNAIYFKGDWKEAFPEKLTRVEPFYVSDTKTVDCQMMHIQSYFGYANDNELDAQLLKLPYQNENVNLVIILPNKRDGINELERKLTNKSLTTLTKRMYQTEVKVSLPKFKIESTIQLNEPLQKVIINV